MGDEDTIAVRVIQIRKQIGETTSDFDEERLQGRLIKPIGGIAVVCIGAVIKIGVKEAKLHMKNTLDATGAAVEEGIITGGGSACVHTTADTQKIVDGLEDNKKTGTKIILKVLEAPLFHIVANAGLESSVTVNKIKESKTGTGFDIYKEEFIDMIEADILNPIKVTRSAFQDATNVASALLATKSVVASIREPAPTIPATPGMGGMY